MKNPHGYEICKFCGAKIYTPYKLHICPKCRRKQSTGEYVPHVRPSKNPARQAVAYFTRNPLGPGEKYWYIALSNGNIGITKGKTRTEALKDARQTIRADYSRNSGITIKSIRSATDSGMKWFKAMGGHVDNPLGALLTTVGNAAVTGVGLGIGFGAVNYAQKKLSKKSNPRRKK